MKKHVIDPSRVNFICPHCDLIYLQVDPKEDLGSKESKEKVAKAKGRHIKYECKGVKK